MLRTLHIKNYALIENLTVEFLSGFNAITGETGAGKSIIIGALGLLLGERASTEAVRKGAVKSVVEGFFEATGNKKLIELLKKNDIDIEPELIVRREISAKGSSRSFLNDTPVNLTILKEAGNLLVDLHGQHDHQSLLQAETHIDLLDECGSYETLLSEFQNKRTEFLTLSQELFEILKKEEATKEKKDLYEFQIKEIDEVSPELDEENKLEVKLNKLENSEKLSILSSEVYNGIYDNENSTYDGLTQLKNKLAALAEIDKEFNIKVEECESALAIIDDIATDTLKYQSTIESNPAELEIIRERLGAFNLLKKKYGGSISAILIYREKIGNEFELASNFSEVIKSKEAKIELLRNKLCEIAIKLSKQRKKLANEIEKEVVLKLVDLGIENSQFKILQRRNIIDSNNQVYVVFDNQKIRFDKNGIDEIEFLISTNLGEDPKSLTKVASGGEISRIMLALKSVLAKNEKLPLLVFDEIDTGVSGRIAQKVGNAMKVLATHHQIIAITHLPQIAGLADHHYFVQKREVDTRVVSEINKLDLNERIVETAKLLSGETVTEATLESARELINS